jgi:hypothetical protein
VAGGARDGVRHPRSAPAIDCSRISRNRSPSQVNLEILEDLILRLCLVEL